MDTLKRLFLAAVGGSTLTYEKAQELVSELVDKGTVTIEQSKALMEDLKQSIDEHRNKSAVSEETSAVDELRLEVEDLKTNIDHLTAVVEKLVDDNDHTTDA